MKFLAFSDNHASYMFTSKLIEQGKKADFLVAECLGLSLGLGQPTSSIKSTVLWAGIYRPFKLKIKGFSTDTTRKFFKNHPLT